MGNARTAIRSIWLLVYTWKKAIKWAVHVSASRSNASNEGVHRKAEHVYDGFVSGYDNGSACAEQVSNILLR